jgi:hypothetical protein
MAMRVIVEDGQVSAIEINTPRTWALRFARAGI